MSDLPKLTLDWDTWRYNHLPNIGDDHAYVALTRDAFRAGAAYAYERAIRTIDEHDGNAETAGGAIVELVDAIRALAAKEKA